MNKFQGFSAIVMVATLVYSQSSFANNMRFLNYSPVSKFTDKDWDIAKTAGRKILNTGEDGDSVTWENPDSKHGGTMTLLATKQKDGVTCRQLKIENHAGNLNGDATHVFCQKPDGTWRASTRR